MADYSDIGPEDIQPQANIPVEDNTAPEDQFKKMVSLGELSPEFSQLTPERVDALVSAARITPEQANELKSRIPGEQLRMQQAQETQAKLNAQKASNPARYAQENQQAMDTVENTAMQDTGVAPGFQNIPPDLSLVGDQVQGLPATLEKPAVEIQSQELAKATRIAAAQNAKRIVQTDQMKKQADAVNAAHASASKTERQVKNDLDSSGSLFLGNIMDGAAIMIGAYSQAFTGSKTNPGLDAINKRIEQEVQNRKYNAEQEAALRKIAGDAANLRLEQMKMMTENAYKISMIEKNQADIRKLTEGAGNSQQIAALIAQPVLTREQVLAVQASGKDGMELGNLYVPIPGYNKFARAVGNQQSVNDLKKYMGDVGTVVPDINSIIDIVTSPGYSSLDLTTRAIIKTRIGALVGNLRIPFTGPGVLTNDERYFLLDTIGDPTKIFALDSIQLAKLRTTRDSMNLKTKNAYRNYVGIELPDTQLQGQIETGMQKGYSKNILEAAAQKLTLEKRNKGK